MKKYEVWVEATQRKTEEIGYVKPWEKWTFDTLEEAKKFFETEGEEWGRTAYSYFVSAEKKEAYYTVSLVELDVEVDEDGNEEINDTIFLDGCTVGKHYLDMKYNDYKKVYLVEREDGSREFWTVKNDEGITTFCSLRNEESMSAKDTSIFEDKDGDVAVEELSSKGWSEQRLTDEQFEHLFDNVKIIDERWCDYK